jgi:glycosyltransferase involved in cell wall biosynthesis
MKILFLNHNLIWRGTFFRCLGFARELVRLGHEVDIWTVSRQKNIRGSVEVIDGVRVWQTPRWGGVGRHDGGYAPVDILFRLLRCLNGRWDVVHAFDHRPNVLLPWLVFLLKRKMIRSRTRLCCDWCDWWTCGGITSARRRFSFIDRVEQIIEEKSKILADHVTVISSVLEERALGIGVKRERLHVVPSGVSVENFPLLERMECRKKIGLPEEGPVFGFIGFSLWDLALLADAFSMIKEQCSQAKLLVIGGGVEEQAKEVLIFRFTAGRDIFLPGVVSFSEVPLYLGACDIQCLPMEDTMANRARIPNKLFDYYASGRAVVASDLGDTGRFVREHKTGLSAENNPASFADCCLRLWKDDAFREECGYNARCLAEQDFSFKQVTQTFLRGYTSISFSP